MLALLLADVIDCCCPHSSYPWFLSLGARRLWRSSREFIDSVSGLSFFHISSLYFQFFYFYFFSLRTRDSLGYVNFLGLNKNLPQPWWMCCVGSFRRVSSPCVQWLYMRKDGLDRKPHDQVPCYLRCPPTVTPPPPSSSQPAPRPPAPAPAPAPQSGTKEKETEIQHKALPNAEVQSSTSRRCCLRCRCCRCCVWVSVCCIMRCPILWASALFYNHCQ